jgi:hypothetical protein
LETKIAKKHPKGQKFFAVEIFQIRSNVHTPFATSLFPRRCLAWVDWELMTTTFDIDEARGRWPSDASELPADAQAAFAVWSQAPATAVKAALERDAAWRRPGAGISYRKLDKARDLVLLRTPFPRNVRTDGARPLTAERVARIGIVTEEDTNDDDDDQQTSSVEDQLAEMRRTQADLQETINSQAATIQQLFKAQHVEHTEGDLSSTYEVIDEVLAKIGFDATKKACSWMNILPMTLQERKLMMREHGGTFSLFPPELDMLETTKMRSEVRKANLTLLEFASKEVSRYMQRNALTIKMAGTALSRVVEMRRQLSECVVSVDDEDVVPISDVLNFLEVLEGTTNGTMELAVDTQTHLRLAVSRRIETALGVGHLRKDPLKKVKEDFLPPDTYEIIADAAQKKEGLSWAQQNRLATVKNSSSHGGPSQKPTGGRNNRGAFSQCKKATGGSRGRGRGKGNGQQKKTQSTPKPDESSNDSSAKKKTGKGKGKWLSLGLFSARALLAC